MVNGVCFFPIRARISRFVRANADSCAPFPVRARDSRFVRAIPGSGDRQLRITSP